MTKYIKSKTFPTKGEAIRAIDRQKAGYRKGKLVYYGPMKTNSISCWLSQKSTNKKGDKGYIKCKLPGATGPNRRKEEYIHILSIIADGRSTDLCTSKQVSHLCHNPKCFNPKHLIVESQANNLDRNKCKGWTWIKYPNSGDLTFNPCQHKPQCILPTNPTTT